VVLIKVLKELIRLWKLFVRFHVLRFQIILQLGVLGLLDLVRCCLIRNLTVGNL